MNVRDLRGTPRIAFAALRWSEFLLLAEHLIEPGVVEITPITAPILSKIPSTN
jgi:hypothetical protein